MNPIAVSLELVNEPDPEDREFTMNEGEPSVPPSGDATRLPVVCGKLADALDAELAAAWEDEAWVELLCHDERLIEAVANYEYAVALLRSALVRLSPPGRPALRGDRRPRGTDGSRADKGETPE